ncbi:MAG: hypothetical protein ABEK59_13115 [Halobacteria archaeon]
MATSNNQRNVKYERHISHHEDTLHTSFKKFINSYMKNYMKLHRATPL